MIWQNTRIAAKTVAVFTIVIEFMAAPLFFLIAVAILLRVSQAKWGVLVWCWRAQALWSDRPHCRRRSLYSVRPCPGVTIERLIGSYKGEAP